jgi:flagellar motor protein MotB
VLTFSSDALFEPGGAEVKPSAYRSLKKISDAVKKYPSGSITVAGHTDSGEQAGTYGTLLALSEARAKAVRYFMINLLKIRGREIETAGHGDRVPISKDAQKNRRVEILFNAVVK